MMPDADTVLIAGHRQGLHHDWVESQAILNFIRLFGKGMQVKTCELLISGILHLIFQTIVDDG